MGPGWSAKERPSRAWGEGEREGGAGIIMSSNDVGSYERKRTPCEMEMEECSAHLARSSSDGSADINSNSNNNDTNNNDNNTTNNNDNNNCNAATTSADPS